MVIKTLRNIEECEKKAKYSENIEENYIKLVYRYPDLSKNEELELFNEYWSTGNPVFREAIFKCYLKYVYELCKDETGYKLDLVSEGNIVLYEAIDSYDPEGTYTNFKYYVYSKLRGYYKRWARDNEEALAFGMSLNKLKVLESKDIDETESARNARVLRPRLSDQETKANDILFMKKFNQDRTRCLNEEQMKLIDQCFGVNGEEELTQKEVSKKRKERDSNVSKKKIAALRLLNISLNKNDYDNLF